MHFVHAVPIKTKARTRLCKGAPQDQYHLNMTWAKIAAAKITQTGPKGKQGIKWHCPVDVTNQPMIEKFCLTMCQKHNFRDISIRAGGEYKGNPSLSYIR